MTNSTMAFATNRMLASLLIDSDDDNDEEGIEFIPTQIVVDMHRAPRFGHSNRLGILASTNKDEQLEYTSGLKQFTLFCVVPFILWALILVSLKFCYGTHKAGCAAGGGIIDIRALSKQGVSRKKRRTFIVRNWRVQAMFLVVAIMIPTISLLLMKVGWPHLDTAFVQIKELMQDVESWSFKGQLLVKDLQSSFTDLEAHVFLQQAQRSANESVFDQWCPQTSEIPKNQTMKDLRFLKTAFDSLQSSLQQVERKAVAVLPTDMHAFASLQTLSQQTTQTIEWTMQNDWKLKMFLLVLNVITLFLLGIVYFVSRNNIIHPPTRAYTQWFLLPVFTALTVALLVITAVIGIAALVNADFCTGGGDAMAQSPQGTFKDAIRSFQHGSFEEEGELNSHLQLAYDSFSYYSNGCLTEHPLEFLEDFSKELNKGSDTISQLSGALNDAQGFKYSIELISQECGADLSYLPRTFDALDETVQQMATQLQGFVELTSCQKVSPMIRRVTYGAICQESATGVVWVWASCFGLLACCFLILTLRAALFNSVKARKPREKKPKRIVEKEFEEYKEYMTQYYDPEQVSKWKLHGNAKKKIEFDLGSAFLQPTGTFETDPSSTPDSERGGIFSFEQEDSDDNEEDHDGDSDQNQAAIISDNDINRQSRDDCSDDSSYESCSDDSTEEEEDDDDQSALVSFFVETKSMAKQGVQNVKDMGGNIRDFGSVVGGSVMGGASDDGSSSVLSSFWSEASSLARQTAMRVVTLPTLLGGGNASQQQEEQDDSILDDSLFLSPTYFDQQTARDPPPTATATVGIATQSETSIATNQGGRTRRPLDPKGSHSIREKDSSKSSQRTARDSLTSSTGSTQRGLHSIWRLITPTSNSGKQAKTPTAPQKKIRFLSRTSDFIAKDEEMQALTPSRGTGNHDGISLQPIQLHMSPYADATTTFGASEDSTPRHRQRQQHTRLSQSEEEDESPPARMFSTRSNRQHPKSAKSMEKSVFFKI